MRSILIVSVVLLCLAAIIAGAAMMSLSRPYAAFSGETFVDVTRGSNVRSVATRLVEAGVIRYQWQLRLASAILRRPVQAGEYRFAEPASVWAVYDRLARGDIFFNELVVREGSNMFEIAASLSKLRVSMTPSDFLRVAREPALVRDLDSKAPSLEGFLFPATYRVARNASAERLAMEMTSRFRTVWKELIAEHQHAPVDLHRVVTMASLVEKETAVPDERPLVASVYENRLKIGMPLQCDPTTIYAALLEDRFRGTIHQSDLRSQNAYNTYRHAGLPPGPIANPGRLSLQAALAPADTGYLYLVAKGDGSGSHVFSSDLRAHNAAVGEYRKALLQQGAGSR
jgi:UPF0755 protein